MSGDSTSINDLPLDPVTGGSIGGGPNGGGSQSYPKVELQISEMTKPPTPGSMSLDQQTISQIKINK